LVEALLALFEVFVLSDAVCHEVLLVAGVDAKAQRESKVFYRCVELFGVQCLDLGIVGVFLVLECFIFVQNSLVPLVDLGPFFLNYIGVLFFS